MNIEVAKQRLLLIKDQITSEDAKDKAWQKKLAAFGTLNQVTGFLSKPKDEDFEITYSEHRYEPFWHVEAKARYVYARSADYQVPVAKKEVKSVSVHDVKYDVTNGHIHLPVIESCAQEESDETLTDGVSGKIETELKRYLAITPNEVVGELRDEVSEGSILIPPQARVSAIVRDSLSKMIKGIQADTILEERVEVTHVDLYYRPVYAHKILWKSKQKESILEVDGITGETQAGGRVFKEYFGKVLERDFLFDIGADAVGMFVPGGSIAVKAAKRFMDARK